MKPLVSIMPERPEVALDPQRIFSQKQRAEIFKNAGGLCGLCNNAVRGKWLAGHIIPWALGGRTTTENGRVECMSCADGTQKADCKTAARDKRLRGETGQRARRERNGSKLRSRNTLGGEAYQARKAFAEKIRRETE